MSKKSLTKINALSEADISAVIQLAWEDRTSFETIEERLGVGEADVIKIMRKELKAGSLPAYMLQTRYCLLTNCNC
jgi:predicted transcriptional regulator